MQTVPAYAYPGEGGTSTNIGTGSAFERFVLHPNSIAITIPAPVKLAAASSDPPASSQPQSHPADSTSLDSEGHQKTKQAPSAPAVLQPLQPTPTQKRTLLSRTGTVGVHLSVFVSSDPPSSHGICPTAWLRRDFRSFSNLVG